MRDKTELYKVAVVDYFATGEGHTVYVVAGDDKTIEEVIPAFFRQGMVCMNVQAWLEESRAGDNSQFPHEVAVIKSFAPFLWLKIQKVENDPVGHFSFSMNYHTNYS